MDDRVDYTFAVLSYMHLVNGSALGSAGEFAKFSINNTHEDDYRQSECLHPLINRYGTLSQ